MSARTVITCDKCLADEIDELEMADHGWHTVSAICERQARFHLCLRCAEAVAAWIAGDEAHKAYIFDRDENGTWHTYAKLGTNEAEK